MPADAGSSRLRRALALSRRERFLLAEAWWELGLAALRLRFAPSRSLRPYLELRPPPGSSAPPPGIPPPPPKVRRPDLGADLALAVARAASLHLRPLTCLPRSLAILRMLARRDYAATLRIGVRRGHAGIAAHAWVEVAGVAVGEPAVVEERFQALLHPIRGLPEEGRRPQLSASAPAAPPAPTASGERE